MSTEMCYTGTELQVTLLGVCFSFVIFTLFLYLCRGVCFFCTFCFVLYLCTALSRRPFATPDRLDADHHHSNQALALDLHDIQLWPAWTLSLKPCASTTIKWKRTFPREPAVKISLAIKQSNYRGCNLDRLLHSVHLFSHFFTALCVHMSCVYCIVHMVCVIHCVYWEHMADLCAFWGGLASSCQFIFNLKCTARLIIVAACAFFQGSFVQGSYHIYCVFMTQKKW